MPRKGKNIFKRKDERWEGRYIKARDGNKAVYGYVFGKSYLEVKQKKAEAISRIDHEKNQVKKQIQPKSPTLENIAFQWLEELKPIHKKSTIVKYMEQLKNYIIPTFGNLKLNEISNEDIISFSRKLLIEEQQGRKLSPKTVSDIISRMKSIRRFALLRGYEVNYIPNVVEIPLRQRQIRILTIFEENKILRYLKITLTSSVLSTAVAKLGLYTDPVVARNMVASDFRIQDIMDNNSPVSLYLVLNPTNIQRLKPLVRLFISQLIFILMPEMEFKGGQMKAPYKHRLLLLLDEFPAFGKLGIFEQAIAYFGS